MLTKLNYHFKVVVTLAYNIFKDSIATLYLGAGKTSCKVIGANLSEAHHMRSTVKFVFLFAYLLDMYMSSLIIIAS